MDIDVVNKIDSLIMPAIKDRNLTTPPASPSEGDRYLVAAGGSGAWNGHDGELAIYYSEWIFLAPKEGWTFWIDDENTQISYDGGSWVGGTGTLNGLSDVTIAGVTENEVLAFDQATGHFINQTRVEAGLAPAIHGLDTGGYHTVAGLTPGHFLKATGAATFGFAAHGLTFADLSLDDRYYTEAELDAGQLDNRYFTETEINNTFMPLAGGRVIGAGKVEWGDAGTYIYQSADSILSYVADGMHEFTGGPVYAGSGSPGHLTPASGELYVAGKAEFDARVYFDDVAEFWSAATWKVAGSVYAQNMGSADDGWMVTLRGVAGTANRNMIITDYDNRAQDHDHDTLSADPTVFIQSHTPPNDANDEWLSLSFPVTHALLAVGSGWFEITPDILSPNNAKHYFDGGASQGTEYIWSAADGHLNIEADTSIDLNADTVVAAAKVLDCYTNAAYLKPRLVSQASPPTPEVGEVLLWYNSAGPTLQLMYCDPIVGSWSVSLAAI